MTRKETTHQSRGFTLIEVIVSLGLLIMVFGGVTSLAILSTEAALSAKNNLIAAYLAQEGQELVRYTRDKNYLLESSPFTNISTEDTENPYKYFIIDHTGTITSTGTNSDVTESTILEIASNLHGYTAGTDTIFRRLVTTTYYQADPTLPAYIDVKVEVYWKEDTRRNTYILTSELTDWR